MAHEKSIRQITDDIKNHFSATAQPLSFAEYLEAFLANPEDQLRGAAQYIRDAFDFFGTREVDTPMGKRKRYKLFDAQLADGQGRVAGQELAQQAIYKLLNTFARSGRVDRLILLHGPNGSAKTSIIRAISAAMEHYSTSDQGKLYAYRWLFPSAKNGRGHIGFGDEGSRLEDPGNSYAHLPGEALDAVLPCGLKDHPLLLIPREQRIRLFADLKEQGRLAQDFQIPDYLLRGDLCAQCRAIHDAMLASYGGDAAEVLRHVQVQRLELSGRYRRGVATVEPQMHVDAGEQQLTASQDLSALPPAIAHLNIFALRGPLVDANRGLLEYDNLLKRPIDSFKYLLVTCENGQVTMDRSTLFLDTVFIGSSNEMMLESFKAYPDFASFKGRLELVRVPYLVRTSEEIQIYADQVRTESLERHLAPHTLELAALWAVLTRLRQPDSKHFESKELQKAVKSLSPLDKAKLYDSGHVPDLLNTMVAKQLKQAVATLAAWQGKNYEGATGASARAVRMLLMSAAQASDRPCLSPLGLFSEIEALLRDKSIFSFLQRDTEGAYLDQDGILKEIKKHYLDLLEDEAAESMGLATDTSYQELFERYIQHVNAWLKNENVHDPVTRKSEPASDKIMTEVEQIIRPEDEKPEPFRKGLIAQIGAYALDQAESGNKPEGPPDYVKVFPRLFDRIKENFVSSRKEIIQRNFKSFLALSDGELLEGKDAEVAARMRESLVERFGYCDKCAAESMAFLLGERY